MMFFNVKAKDLKPGDIVLGGEFYLLCLSLKNLDEESFCIRYITISGSVRKIWIENCEQFNIWRSEQE